MYNLLTNKTLAMYELFKNEFNSCLFSIINEPNAIDVDYYFYRMNELTTALKEYVSKCNTTDYVS